MTWRGRRTVEARIERAQRLIANAEDGGDRGARVTRCYLIILAARVCGQCCCYWCCCCCCCCCCRQRWTGHANILAIAERTLTIECRVERAEHLLCDCVAASNARPRVFGAHQIVAAARRQVVWRRRCARGLHNGRRQWQADVAASGQSLLTIDAWVERADRLSSGAVPLGHACARVTGAYQVVVLTRCCWLIGDRRSGRGGRHVYARHTNVLSDGETLTVDARIEIVELLEGDAVGGRNARARVHRAQLVVVGTSWKGCGCRCRRDHNIVVRQTGHANVLTDWQRLTVERRIEREESLRGDAKGGGDCVARVAHKELIVVGACWQSGRGGGGGTKTWHADDLTDGQALAVERRIESEQGLGGDAEGRGDHVARVAAKDAIVVVTRGRGCCGGCSGWRRSAADGRHADVLANGQGLTIKRGIESDEALDGGAERARYGRAAVADKELIVVGARRRARGCGQARHADDLTDWQALAVERRIESEQRLSCDLIGGGDCVARVAVEEQVVVGARRRVCDDLLAWRCCRSGALDRWHADDLAALQRLAVEALRVERVECLCSDLIGGGDGVARVAAVDAVVVEA